MEEASPWTANHHRVDEDDDDHKASSTIIIKKAKGDIHYLVAKNNTSAVQQEVVCQDLRRWHESIMDEIETALNECRRDWHTVVHYQQKIERLQSQLVKLTVSPDHHDRDHRHHALHHHHEVSPRGAALEDKIRRNEGKLVTSMHVFAQSEEALLTTAQKLQYTVWTELQEFVANFAGRASHGSNTLVEIESLVETAMRAASASQQSQSDAPDDEPSPNRLPAQISRKSGNSPPSSPTSRSSTSSSSCTSLTPPTTTTRPARPPQDHAAPTTGTTITPCSLSPADPPITRTSSRRRIMGDDTNISGRPVVISPQVFVPASSASSSNSRNIHAETTPTTTTKSPQAAPWAQATIMVGPSSAVVPPAHPVSPPAAAQHSRRHDMASAFPTDILADPAVQQPRRRLDGIIASAFPTDILAESVDPQLRRRQQDGIAVSAFPTDILAGHESTVTTPTNIVTPTAMAAVTRPNKPPSMAAARTSARSTITTTTPHRNHQRGHGTLPRGGGGEDVEIDLSSGFLSGFIHPHVYEELYGELERS